MRSQPDALMLFAAGFGTRMGELTATRPKPLIEVAGKALLDHALEIAQAAGIRRRVVNLGYLGDQIRAHLAGQAILFSDETGSILETGGGLRRATGLLGGGPVFTLNTDAVWTGSNPLTALAAAWDAERMDALALLVPRDRATGHAGPGDFTLDAAGRLARGRDYVYTGAQIIQTTAVQGFEEEKFSLNPVWDRIAAEGRLFGCVHSGGWCDVGRPECIEAAEDMIRRHGNVRA
ncbi:MAG: nucleotidyltransferase family protein [Defluviimonas sp.]|uniref:nucleotidyltransferase family protein n=1 Tax=Albidovulum sp. TaxID=1872424 RepID=UPI002A2DEF47|nr:nucleotidyltransferase family protein [Defluviimonas sp.]